ncbi:alpha/beta fold hydrolase [Parasphingopyxis sp.]|uniref:alpha/beta hydrolase n=1 Tax=Parasphingopyxis sp. TaxID=1920299 RepID=UPI00260671B7|nr:alpha/beta fold hydrolase [Parasphingopyxis sp.]
MFFRLAIAICALVAVAGCDSLARDAIYHPPQAPLTLEGLPAGTELITVDTADGLTLSGIVATGRRDRPVLLLFHGNAASASGIVRWLAPLAEAGFGIVAAEYRGYSGNPGTPTQEGIAHDADAFLALAEELAGSRPVIVIGHSLGGGVAFDLSRRERLDALITIGTFTSTRDMAPGWARGLVPDPYDSLTAVNRADEAVFLIHGRADEVVPFDHMQRLAQAAAQAELAGASIALDHANHVPSGEKISRIIRHIADQLDSPDDEPSRILTGMTWESFEEPAS